MGASRWRAHSQGIADGEAMRPAMSAQRVHLVGIGGAGLSAIATVLLEQGCVVSGSDLCVSAATERLAGMGATIYKGHAAANLGDADAIVVSSAVPAGNPEMDEAQRRSIPVYRRAEWLSRMMASECKRGVAVAGTHGKTTTTAMIALIARDAGLEPTFIVGGDIRQLGTGAAAGAGDVFIIEADEYDRTFLGLSPEIAVITVVEWDHPDCYPTAQSMVEAFQQFVASVPATGLIVGCGDDPGVRDLIAHSRSNGQLSAPVVTYGQESDNEWRAVELHLNMGGGYDFSVMHPDGPVQKVSLAVPGVHNVQNALAALVVADRLSLPPEQTRATLAGFSGVARRFEVKGEVGGISVVDDYAHHPTEIKVTLTAARTRYRDRPIWAVFQPHTYSRTHALLDDFAAVFSDANHVIIVDVFAAREADEGLVNSQHLVARVDHPDVRYIGPLSEAVDALVAHLQPNAVLITLGAGDGYRVGEMVLEALKARGQVAESEPPPADDPGVEEGVGIGGLADVLGVRFGDRLRRGEPLAKHTVLGVGGPADLWLSVTTLEELIETVMLARHHHVPFFLMGNGANVLVSDHGIRGLVVHNRCQQVVVEAGEPPRITAESGAILVSLARKVAQQGISGLEWAIGIPGTVGGAVVNNAGAYGSSIADSLVRAEVLTPGDRREWQPGGWFEYEYRGSRLKGQPAGGAVVLQAELMLSYKSPEQIEDQMTLYNKRRKTRQPAGATIGSMFKNPPGGYAGRLIEEAGLKGTRVGGAEISSVHANFFVNRGTARAADFAALIDLAHDTVQDRFGIDMKMEIQKVGVWSD